ncbi:MAG: RluA family pseudouridine synthase [Rickettsiales bacterium]|jgi:23S rRNA pseudouridine955/2504/2580 synthase|nr:RluA family pseudouridine synthase [Rickettsiales bacterium]
MEIKDIVVGEKIYKFLKGRYRTSFGNLQKFFREKSLKVNGKKVNENYALRLGDVISANNFVSKILLGNPRLPKQTGASAPNSEIIEKIKKSIIFEDEKILAVNKPYGLSVQGGRGIKISLDDILPFLGDGGETKPKLVHRLDRDTTGVIIVAKDSKTAENLSKQFKKGGQINKFYLAAANGKFKKKEGTINIPLAKRYENGVEKIYADSIGGKESVTRYRVLGYNAKFDVSLVEANIITGRTHQIRVHLKEIGHPIVGDFKYGTPDEKISGRMLLHSHRMRLKLSGKEYNLTADAPPEFGELFGKQIDVLELGEQ